ncbi:hypothetical protein BHM03_00062008 [Ensete ventricosum]|nr:hypothetical protein BHM03_00062008 [Ensete ventricosum]
MKKEGASQGGGRQQWRKRAAVKKTGWKRQRQRVAAAAREEKRVGTERGFASKRSDSCAVDFTKGRCFVSSQEKRQMVPSGLHRSLDLFEMKKGQRIHCGRGDTATCNSDSKITRWAAIAGRSGSK